MASPTDVLNLTNSNLEQYLSSLSSSPSTLLLLNSPSTIAKYIKDNKISHVLFDCDGVIYRSSTPTSPTLIPTLRKLEKSLSISIGFVTNSSGKSRLACMEKMVQVTGLDDTFRLEAFFPAGYAAARYLKEVHPTVKKAFVIGGEGLVEELENVGIECLGGPANCHGANANANANGSGYDFSVDEKQLEELEFDKDVGAVVIGMAKDFNYRMLTLATTYLTSNEMNSKNIQFVSTNLDPFDVIGPKSRRQPAAGCMVKAVEFAVGRESVTVGKPSEFLWDVVRKELEGENANANANGNLKLNLNLQPENVLMVGDRIDTDIRFGKNCGFKTAVVLSGCTTGEELAKMEREGAQELPDVVIPHVGLFCYEDGDIDLEKKIGL